MPHGQRSRALHPEPWHRSDVCTFPSARTIEERPRSFGEQNHARNRRKSTGNGRPSHGEEPGAR
eukprot:2598709-Pyramimonas_sp.AAC.1